jgi:formate dehydrogenase subunit delta
MKIESLVLMANRIGEFFAAMPDREEALKGISDHIRRFWALRMRLQLTTHLRGDAFGVSPIVREALLIHSVLPPPTAFDSDSPEETERRHALDGASES